MVINGPLRHKETLQGRFSKNVQSDVSLMRSGIFTLVGAQISNNVASAKSNQLKVPLTRPFNPLPCTSPIMSIIDGKVLRHSRLLPASIRPIA